MLGLAAARLLLTLSILLTSRPDGISARPHSPWEVLDHDLEGRPARDAAAPWCAHNRALLRKRGVFFSKGVKMEEAVATSVKDAEHEATSSNALKGLHGDAHDERQLLSSQPQLPAQKDGHEMSEEHAHQLQRGDDERTSQPEAEKKQQQDPGNEQTHEVVENKQSEDLPAREQNEDPEVKNDEDIAHREHEEQVELKKQDDADRKQHEDAERKRQDEFKKPQQKEVGRDGQQQEDASREIQKEQSNGKQNAEEAERNRENESANLASTNEQGILKDGEDKESESRKIQQEESEGKPHTEEAEKNRENEGANLASNNKQGTLKDGEDKEKEGGSSSESTEGNDGKGGPGSESTEGENVPGFGDKLEDRDLAEERQRFLNMEHGKTKPLNGFMRAMKSAWQKITEGLAITWNRLVNLLCQRKTSSIHPDGLAEKLLIKKVPFNPNEPLYHKVAREAEYGHLRPPKAPEIQRDPPYTIPRRTAEAPPQPSAPPLELALVHPEHQHSGV